MKTHSTSLVYCLSGLISAAVGALALTLATAAPAHAQPGNCAFCEDCFHCGYDNPWGWEDCENGGGSCPCQGKGDACDPTVLGLTSNLYRSINDLSENNVGVKHALWLEGSIFGVFSCANGNLVDVFREDDSGRLLRLSIVELDAYRTRYHLSNYLDVTGALRSTGELSS